MKFWKKKKRLIIFAALAVVIILNLMAWMHARAMMQFRTSGEATKKPEELSVTEKLKVLLTGVRIPRPENIETPANYKLDFETVRFSGHAGHILEAWYVPHPSAKTMVLLFHGYTKSKQETLPLAVQYYKMGYASLLVDFYGSGGSDGAGTSIGVYEAHDVTAAFNYARKRWPRRPIILHGISMGSAALLRAVSKDRLSPAALVIEAPFNRLLDTVKNRFREVGMPTFPAAELLVFWGGVQKGFNAFKHNPAEYAKYVTCPALLLHGALDTRATAEEARQVFGNLAGPKYFRSFPGVGHSLLINANLEKWQKDVAEFLDKIGEIKD
jgi:alpha-beta hydrolase superfamily lysophospholipase